MREASPGGARILAGDVILGLDAAGKRAAVSAVAAEAASRRPLPEALVLDALLAREALGTTALGRGVALPHARLPGEFAPLALLVRLRRPLDWGARDEEGVDLLIAVLWPESEADGFLPALSRICAALREARTLRRLRAARTADEAASLLHEGAGA